MSLDPSLNRREPSGEPLMTELRELLDEVEANPDAGPHTMPDWQRLTARMRQIRRRRRVRRAGGVVAVTAGVLAAGAGVMTGVVPYPSFAPTVTMPSSGRHSRLYGEPTRGSLAADPAWLNAFRDRVAAEKPDHEGDGELWTPPGAHGVHVLYAGDVGPYRVALVEGDWHWGPLADSQQIWYLARVGAAASAMTKGSSGQPEQTNSEVFAPSYLPRGTGITGSVAIVVGSRPVDVRLAGIPRINADATITPDTRSVPAGQDGVYTAEIDGSGVFTLLVNGHAQGGPITATGYLDGDKATERRSRWTPLRGGPAVRTTLLSMLADQARTAARQAPAAGRFDLLAAADAGQSPRPIVGMVTLPSGARIIAGGSLISSDTSGFDTATLLPAGAASDIAFAWRSTPAEFGDRPEWCAAVGPAGTKTLEWVHADGQVTSSTADHAMAVTPGHDVRTVRFLDADHRLLSTRPVLAPLSGDRVMPQLRTP